MSEANSITLLH